MNKPTYSDSYGDRFTTDQIERKIKIAALEKLEQQSYEFGWNHCETCKKHYEEHGFIESKYGGYIDVSHTISRKRAKEEGIVELLWNLSNLEILCRRHHQEKDLLI